MKKSTLYTSCGIISGLLLGYASYLSLRELYTSYTVSGPGSELIDKDMTVWYSGALAEITLLSCFLLFALLGLYLLRKGHEISNPLRRDTLTGILIGLPLAAILPKFFGRAPLPILPPGATTAEDFSLKCNRCYECVNACPNQIIKIRKRGKLTELLMANVNYSRPVDGQKPELPIVCEEGCNECSTVCPTGAIGTINLEQKHKRQIGIAVVFKEKCIAWSKDEYCLVCDEYCPYNAFDVDKINTVHGELGRPVVNPDRCRGCNACVDACVAPVRALEVKAVKEQKQLKI